MIVTKFDLVLFIILHVSRCERRILDGEQLRTEKTYVVYLVKATMSKRTYDTWLCGGAIVSPEFIITSAACVENVRFMYAIAGYKRYVAGKEIEKDNCTKQMKKKIVRTYVPISVEIDSNKMGKRGFIDIALAKVESPYNFKDERYEKLCSYTPSIILINLEAKVQEAGVNAMVLGWWHTKYWQQLGDHKYYNQQHLHYGTTTLLDKSRCQDEYQNYPNLIKTIEKYMICSYNPHRAPFSKNCVTPKQKLFGMQGVLCEAEQRVMEGVFTGDKTRKNINSLKQTSNENVNDTDIMNRTNIVNGTGILYGTGILNGTGIVNRTDIVNGTGIVNQTDIVYQTGIVNRTDIMKGTSIVNRTDIEKQTGIVNQTDIVDGTDIINRTGILTGTVIVKQIDIVNQTGIVTRTDIEKQTRIVNQIDIVNRTDIVNGVGITNRTDADDSTDFINNPGISNISIHNRRNGICKNDLGGPLVTRAGKKEVLIGVASIFKIADDRECTGPFLYSSTFYNSAFIGCVLNNERIDSLQSSNEIKNFRKILLCDSSPSKKGFDIIEKHLSWVDHPAGPADNERGNLKLKRKEIWEATTVEGTSVDNNPSNHSTTQQISFHQFSLKKDEEKETKIDLLSTVEPPPITGPVTEIDRLSEISSPPKLEPPPITRPATEMERLSLISSPSKVEPPPITRPVTEMERLSLISSPSKVEPPPNTRPATEMERLSLISSPSKVEPPPITRPVTEMERLLIISPPSEMEHPPIIRPLPKMDRILIIRPKSIIRPRLQIDGLSKIRHPHKIDHLSIIRALPEMDDLSKLRLSSEMDDLTKIKLPPEIEHPQMVTSPRKAKLPLVLWSAPEIKPGSPEMPTTNKAILDLQSDESFFKEILFGNLETTSENYNIQPVVRIRHQRPLHKK